MVIGFIRFQGIGEALHYLKTSSNAEMKKPALAVTLQKTILWELVAQDIKESCVSIVKSGILELDLHIGALNVLQHSKTYGGLSD